MNHVLVIKNKRSKAKKIVKGLKAEEGFTITLHNEIEGLDIVWEKAWDIILLDWDSLSMPGPEIFRQIRRTKTTPIIIVTDRISSEDSIDGLKAGADDYIRKPFEKEELVERIKVILKRRNIVPEDTEYFQFKDLLVDPLKNIISKNGENLLLTKREYDLLVFLIKNKNRVLSREALLNQVWGYDVAVNLNVVDLYISYLRKKLKCSKDHRYIHTVHGRGYSMIENE